jgi:hypothetical protein
MQKLMLAGEMLCFGALEALLSRGNGRRDRCGCCRGYWRSSRMRSMRRSGSAAPHSSWSPMV